MRTMRRLAVVVLVTVFGVALLASPASGLCFVQPFDKVLAGADAAWWGTVADATASARGEPGYWRLQVRVEDALKGQPDATTVTVFTSTCGPFMTESQRQTVAGSFVGDRRLFMGDLNADGAMLAYSDILTPQGLSPHEQYKRALDELGLTREGSASPLAPFVDGGLPWWIIAAGIALVVGAAALVLLRRRAH